MTRTYYQLKPEERSEKIRIILKKLPTIDPTLEARLEQLTINYQGRDHDALSVLHLAARLGRFQEYLSSLEEAHTDSFHSIHPSDRGKDDKYGKRFQDYFIECYSTLGVVKGKPIKEQLERVYEQTQPASRSA